MRRPHACRSRALRPFAAALVGLLLLGACGSTGEADPEQQLQMHREFALRYFDEGDLARAEQQVDKGLEIDEDDEQLLLMKGWIRQRRGTAQDILIAEAIFRELDDDEDFRVELGLGEALERKGVLYREAAEAVESGDRFTEASDPKERAAELAETAEDCWSEALECYAQALALKPGEFQAMNGLQRVHALRGEYQKSLDWAEDLLEGSKAEMEFWRERLRRPELSATEEERLRNLLRGSTELQTATHLTAATLLVALDRKEEAVAHLEGAAVLEPDRAEIQSRRAQLLSELGRPEEAALAVQAFLRNTKLPFEHPDVQRAYDLLSECERAARREAAAAQQGG
jgi:tetratricopeptide (TPR) repeat protein